MSWFRWLANAGVEVQQGHSFREVLERGLWWAERIFHFEAGAVIAWEVREEPVRDLAGEGTLACSRGFHPAEALYLSREAVARWMPGLREASKARAACLDGQWWCAVPLPVDADWVGLLVGRRKEPEGAIRDLEEALGLFGANLSVAIRNVRLVETAFREQERLARWAKDLTALNEIGLRIATFTDLDGLVSGALDLARQSLFFRSCALLLRDGEDLVVRAHYGFEGGVRNGQRIPRGKGVSWRCLEQGQPLLIPDVSGVPDHLPGRPDARCEMVAPLMGPYGAVGVLAAESPKPHAFNDTSLELFATFAHQIAAALENARLNEANRRNFYQTIRALAQALEMRDSYTRGHSERVRNYALRIADSLEMSPTDRECLEQAALLHDIGKIGVRDSVLLKKGHLDTEERAAIERHPVIGDSILHPVGFLREALEAVLHHHEHWDGTGYPDGQAGERIPLVARVIAVADAYDAMTSDRPYRAALSHQEACREIERGAGRQFDPAVVRAFLRAFSGTTAPSPFEEAPLPA
ncbi:HD domain-containing protein [Myxococcota bacterium]|jgi:putative nucleotidyltransferase with HDIG domain|nr:HD domain-containing protein [Myxococcota bacterium]